MVKIVQKENPILREKAKEVPVEEIGSKKVQKIITNMKKALATEPDGVAIAAPQIEESLRVFVMSKRVFKMMPRRPANKTGIGVPTKTSGEHFKDLVFINPRITKMSREKEESEEGCLSVRYLYGKVMRAKKATIEAYDERGKKFISGGSGIIAQIFQHECDHLDGILFTDKAKNLREILPEEMKK